MIIIDTDQYKKHIVITLLAISPSPTNSPVTPLNICHSIHICPVQSDTPKGDLKHPECTVVVVVVLVLVVVVVAEIRMGPMDNQKT